MWESCRQQAPPRQHRVDVGGPTTAVPPPLAPPRNSPASPRATPQDSSTSQSPRDSSERRHPVRHPSFSSSRSPPLCPPTGSPLAPTPSARSDTPSTPRPKPPPIAPTTRRTHTTTIVVSSSSPHRPDAHRTPTPTNRRFPRLVETLHRSPPWSILSLPKTLASPIHRSIPARLGGAKNSSRSPPRIPASVPSSAVVVPAVTSDVSTVHLNPSGLIQNDKTSEKQT